MNENAKLWVEKLRSGEFQQGKLALHRIDNQDSYCCLGVACELYRQATGKGEWVGERQERVVQTRMAFEVDGEYTTDYLPSPVIKWLGLASPEASFCDPYVESDGCHLESLYRMNDRGYDFPIIAHKIEEEPKGLFVDG